MVERIKKIHTQKIIGEALRKLRIDAKLTQNELAEIVGLPQSNIARAESGNVSTTLSLLDKIATALNKQVKVSFEDMDDKVKEWTFPLELFLDGAEHRKAKRKELYKWAEDLSVRVEAFLDLNRIIGTLQEIRVNSTNVLFHYILERGNLPEDFKEWENILRLLLQLAGVKIDINKRNLYIRVQLEREFYLPIDLKTLLEEGLGDNFKNSLMAILGRDEDDNVVSVDLSKHSLMSVTGITGSGKSLGMLNLLFSIMAHSTPEQVNFSFVDTKLVEYTPLLENSPFSTGFFNRGAETIELVEGLVKEVERRKALLSRYNLQSISDFNGKIDDKEISEEKLIPLIAIIDEYADVKRFNEKIPELINEIGENNSAQVGVHLILVTQRPHTLMFEGINEKNITSRWVFRTAKFEDEALVLGNEVVESLRGVGDSYLVETYSSKTQRLQVGYIGQRALGNIEKYIEHSYS